MKLKELFKLSLFGKIVIRITKEQDSKKEYQELYKNVEEEVYDSLARTFDHHTELERDMLVTNIFRFVQKEKAESYKEGFWNGQKAKIEEVKFSDKDALSKDEIEDIKKSLKQQDYTNPLS